MYHIIVEYTELHGWQPQFGDYDRETVRDELREYKRGNKRGKYASVN